MAVWGVSRWDAAYWSTVEGVMAATETGVDTFAATGAVIDTGYMAATETSTDTFSASGAVIDNGHMAATETEVDTFAASGGVIDAGYMAAVETGEDVFAATGAVITTGYMAATETQVDTFAAVGGVITSGYMAATETGVDTFSASGQVIATGYMAATETEVDSFAAIGVVTPPVPVPVITADIGPGDEKQRKKAQKKRDEVFEKYAQEQRKLRETIEQAINPVKAQTAPVVVSEGKKKVEVLSVDGSAISIPVPLAFSAEEVARLVGEALQSAKIEARRVQRKQDEARALEAARVELARIIKRKRDDELLLLMD